MDELQRKEQVIASLKATKPNQDSHFVQEVAKDAELTASKNDTPITDVMEHDMGDSHGSFTHSSCKITNGTGPQVTELERLRTQNSALMTEIASLRSKLDSVCSRDHKSKRCGESCRDAHSFSSDGGVKESDGSGNLRNRVMSSEEANRARTFKNRRGSTAGPLFYEGQAVECRVKCSDNWRSATVDSVRSVFESVGDTGDRGDKTFNYTVWFDKGGSEKDVPEGRIRSLRGNDQDSSQPPRTVHRDGEAIIRMRVFVLGENVLARDGGSRGELSHAKIVRRNEDGTYCVAFNGSSEERDLHSTMLHSLDDDLQQKLVGRDEGDTVGAEDDSCGDRAKSVAVSAAEEAELRYAAKRESLLTAACGALPGLMKVGQEVLARYPGRDAWGPGLVVGLSKDGLHLSIDFDSGEFVDKLPFIFVRSRFTGNLSRGKSQVYPGDAVLAQKEGTPSSGDWYLAHFKSYQRNGDCSLIFDGEEATTTINAARAQLLYDRSTKDGPAEIPGFSPPPTKPVRTKKRHDGDIVMACIPKVKAWSPALVTVSEGRGRYTVEWADGEKANSLLFVYMASLGKEEQESESTIVTERCASSKDRPAGSSDVRRNDEDIIEGDEMAEAQNAQNAQFCGSVDFTETARALRTHVRLRQPQLKVGEPVLAKSQQDRMWASGLIKNVRGNGKYDVLFTDGSVEEGLSFLFIRTLDFEASGEDDGESAEIVDPSREAHKVGDTVSSCCTQQAFYRLGSESTTGA